MEKPIGAPYTSTPGTYGALFDTAVTTARDTVAQLKASAASYTPMAQYSDNAKLVFSSKNQLAAALQLAAQLIVTGTGVKITMSCAASCRRSEEHTSELQSPCNLVCRLLLEKKKKT